jgi:hypothetical protein
MLGNSFETFSRASETLGNLSERSRNPFATLGSGFATFPHLFETLGSAFETSWSYQRLRSPNIE